MSTKRKLKNFNVFIGTELGDLKGINLNGNHVLCKKFSRDIKKGISSLFWGDFEDQSEVIVGFENQMVCNFDTDFASYSFGQVYNLGAGSLVSAFRKSSLILGFKSGEIAIVNKSTTKINTITKTYKQDKRIKEPTLCCVKPNNLSPSEIATGGCENDLAIWDLNNPSQYKFKAKNVSADMLDLRVPVWISDMDYLPNSNSIVTVSRHKHVRVYDPKTQKKPIINFEWQDRPFTSLAVVPFNDKQVLVGTDQGKMALFDLRRSKGSPLGTFKGFAGGIKAISVHETMKLAFSISLDRFFRVHDLGTRKILYKRYMTSRPSSLLVRGNSEEFKFLTTENTENDSFVVAKKQRLK